MAENRDTCIKCGEKSILKGDIGLRNSKTMDLVVVVRQDHGVEKMCLCNPRYVENVALLIYMLKTPHI